YTDEDIEKCKYYIDLYKQIREMVQFGKLYRLKNYRSDGMYANQYVNDDKSESVLFICSTATSFFNRQFKTIKLKGLDPDATYKVDTPDGEKIRTGSYLMNVPHPMRLADPLESVIWRIRKV
ncbi:MAG: GH36 C-terminal domain-containing protein, partial [Eubacterium sp.]|nr:GH36 C-terminal domain-containing protein [Eubacterium sp.]